MFRSFHFTAIKHAFQCFITYETVLQLSRRAFKNTTTRKRHWRQYVAALRQVGCVAQWYNVGIRPANFPVPRSTYSWWVTTHMGKPSAIGEPTRPTQPFIPSGSIVSCSRMSATSVRGGAIWWTLMNKRQVWCNLHVKLCDPCLSALSAKHDAI